MGFAQELARFKPLSMSLRGNKGSVLEEDMDIDAMERGLACEMPTSVIQHEPDQASGSMRKMVVQRSQDQLQHTLRNEDGTAVLVARTLVDRNRVDVFIASGESGATVKTSCSPAFALTFDDVKSKWQLSSKHCQRCAFCSPFKSCVAHGGQTLARVKTFKDEIGQGMAYCMDVDIPDVAAQAVWCPLVEGAEENRLELASKRPTWNKRLKSLTMDFKGRVESASAKNFQLCLDEEVVLLYGKKKDGTFALEFEHSMSPVQAFGIALTTMFWT